MTALLRDEPHTLAGDPDPTEGSLGREVDPGLGRLLSVAALQQALQVARAGAPSGRSVNRSGDSQRPPLAVEAAVPGQVQGNVTFQIDQGAVEVAPSGLMRAESWPTTTVGAIAVVGAHGGAGASTVALVLADAMAAQGREVRLISRAPSARCGLVAVSSIELGFSHDRLWRRGRRGSRITVERLAGADTPAALPAPDDPGFSVPPLTISDLAASGERLPRSLLSAAVVVLVFRVTVPGVQHAEQVLGELQQMGGGAAGDGLVLLAGVGPRRWPGVVTSSVGPLLRQLQRDGHLVAVPIDRQLERTGLTSAELPNAIGKAGTHLLRLAGPALPDDGRNGHRDAVDNWPTPPDDIRRAAAPAGLPPLHLTSAVTSTDTSRDSRA